MPGLARNSSLRWTQLYAYNNPLSAWDNANNMLHCMASSDTIVRMTMWRPDVSSATGPIYLAIADAIAQGIDAGGLAPGERLPTHR